MGRFEFCAGDADVPGVISGCKAQALRVVWIRGGTLNVRARATLPREAPCSNEDRGDPG